MLPGVPGSAPECFSTWPAGSKYARTLALDHLALDAFNDVAPAIPYQVAPIYRRPIGESVGCRGGYVTRIDPNIRIDRESGLALISGDEIKDRDQIPAHSCDRGGAFCDGSRLLTPAPEAPVSSSIAMAVPIPTSYLMVAVQLKKISPGPRSSPTGLLTPAGWQCCAILRALNALQRLQTPAAVHPAAGSARQPPGSGRSRKQCAAAPSAHANIIIGTARPRARSASFIAWKGAASST